MRGEAGYKEINEKERNEDKQNYETGNKKIEEERRMRMGIKRVDLKVQ
jgi:hypothetical protein